MLPPMWMIEACMNIAVNTVSQGGSAPGSVPLTHPIAWPAAVWTTPH